jgi:hypothetical protein
MVATLAVCLLATTPDSAAGRILVGLATIAWPAILFWPGQKQENRFGPEPWRLFSRSEAPGGAVEAGCPSRRYRH